MTVGSTLSKGVDNFFECPLAVRIAFLLIPVAIIFQVSGFGTQSWSNSDNTKQGLWKYCYDSGDYSCCQSVTDRTGDTPDWLTATQVFQCIAVVLAMVTMVAIILYTCVTKTLKSLKVNIFTIICCILSVFSMVTSAMYPSSATLGPNYRKSVIKNYTTFAIMVSVGIYGDNYRKANWLDDHHLSGSFAVVLIAFFLYAVTAVILIVSECHDRQAPRTTVQPIVTPSPHTDQTATQPRNQRQNVNLPRAPPANRTPNAAQAQAPVQPSAPPMPINQPTPPSQNQSSNECIVCMDHQKEVIFLNCGHIACCEGCADVIMAGERKCPTCRQYIQEKRRCFNA